MKAKCCKHTVGVQAIFGNPKHVFSSAARAIPLGGKRVKGRPKKNKDGQALVLEGSPNANDTEDSDQEESIGSLFPNDYLRTLTQANASQHFDAMFGSQNGLL